ncbi:MAG: hypothetical protein HUU46_04475 [Candidatus Hydrogenedentes bacterium]|nr:hypothetical protein [Candidatus Hydrogenedentota bacterium]
MRHVQAIVLLVTFLGFPAHADNIAALPSLSQAQMQIPWADFRVMWEALSAAKEKVTPPPPKPPAQWSLVEATYLAEAREDSASVKITATFHLQIWEPSEWVRIPLVGDTVAVTGLTLDNAPASLTPDDNGQLTLLKQGAGEHDVNMTFYVAATENQGVVSFEFPCRESAMTRMTLRIPAKDAKVHAPAASVTEVTQTETGVQADLAFPKSQKLAVSWTLPAKLPVAPPAVEPRIACTSWTLAALTESYVTSTVQLRYRILRGDTDTFSVLLPAEVNVLEVAGQGLAWSRQDEESKQRIEIKTNHRVNDSYNVTLAYERPFDGELANIPLPNVPGVVRESGYVGVSARGNVEVNPAATIEGLTRLDTAELPAELRSMSATPLLLAFRYGEGERLLAVDVRRLEDVAVPDSSIDFASLTTLVTADGMAVTRASYDVRNSVRQFLRLNVGKSAEIWSAMVGDRVVKPARDAATGEVLIPLSKSVEVDRRLGSFPVQLLYMQRIAEPKGLWCATDLTAPATDILASTVDWEVLLPERRTLFSSAGDVHPSSSPLPGTIVMQRTGPQPTSVTRQETLYRLREGVERFYITDINGPASQAQAGSPRYSGDMLTPQEAGSSKAASAISGVLPVPVNLPKDGIPYRFGAILAAQGRPLTLTLTTVPRSIVSSIRYTALAAALLGGALAGRFVVARFTRRIWSRGRHVALAACITLVTCAVAFAGATVSACAAAAFCGFALALLSASLRRVSAPKPYSAEAA